MPEAAERRDDRLARLRREIAGLARARAAPIRSPDPLPGAEPATVPAGGAPGPALPFGVAALDARLPDGGLRRGALHEVGEAGAAAAYAALATLFTAAVLARLHGPVLWCLSRRDLFAPALPTVGLCPGRVVFAETWTDAQVLPAMEEGLQAPGLAAVVGEVARLGLTASRRLHLAAERTGVLVIAVRRHRLAGQAADEPGAALTRWRVSPRPGTGPPMPGLPRARWLVELTRARNAAPHSWILDAPDATGRLRLPADLADRPVAPPLPVPRARVG